MKYYAVIDTNVLVSAMLKWDSTPGNILELDFSGMIVPLLNEHIMKEYREVLSRAGGYRLLPSLGFSAWESPRLSRYNRGKNSRV